MSEAVTEASAAPEVRASGAAIARSAFHLVLGQVATTALAIVFSAALGRRLGAADFGLFFLVTTMATFAYVIVEWGQLQYVVRELARHPDRAGLLLGASIALRVAAAVGASLLAVLAARLLGYDARTQGLLALLMATALPFSLSQAYVMVFRARERMDLDALISVLYKALTLLLALSALALGGGVAGVILAQGTAGLAALGFAALQGRRLRLPRLRVTRETCRELLRGGTPILILALTVTVQPYLDAIVLSKLVPPAPVGWYGAARNILGTLIAPASILGAAAYPRLSRAATNQAHLRHELGTALRPVLVLGALAAVGTYLFADLAIGIVYGKRGFAPAATILQVSAPALFLVGIDMVLGSAVMAIGRPTPVAAASAITVAKTINVLMSTALDYLLVPWCQQRYGNGGIGLALAFGSSEFVMLAAMIWLTRGALEAGFAVDVGRSLVACVATLLLFRILPPMPPFLAVPACVLAFGAAAVALGLVRRDEIGSIGAVFLRRRAAVGSAGGAPTGDST